MLKGKSVIIGVTGGIAAYKTANLVSQLTKLNCDVTVIMTQNATNFIHPITFEALTNHKCLIDTFDRNFTYQVEHISLAKKADLFMIAPATANVIGKIANGIADDMLTTTFMACTCKKIIVPAMNTNMYLNPIVQDNIAKCQSFGMEVVIPEVGVLACKDRGIGKMPAENILLEYILRDIQFDKDMSGKNVLVTAGPTQEALDPVRFISNHSTGKMGYAMAKIAMRRGAKVTLVTGITSIVKPAFVETVEVVSAEQMYHQVIELAPTYDIIIKAAAVADYRPAMPQNEKIKKENENLSITLVRNRDILKELGNRKTHNQFLCGFSMETEHLLEHSKRKLKDKKLDMIIANDVRQKGAGFSVDTNIVTIITKEGILELPKMSKDDLAFLILNEIMNSPICITKA